MAASSRLLAPAPAALPRRSSPLAAASSSSCRCPAPRVGRPPTWLSPRRRPAPAAAARPARFCGNVGYEWPAVLAGSTKWGSSKGLRAAGTGGDAGDQAGVDEEEGGDGVRVTNEALRASIRKSKEVLVMHRKLLEQISEKKKLITVIEDSSIHNEQEPFSGHSDGSFSRLDAVSEGKEIDYDCQMYLDRHAHQSEVGATHGESISDENEYYGSLEGKLSYTDVTGSSSEVDYEHYLHDSFPRAAPTVYEPQAVNGMKQDYMAQLSQIREKEQLVTEGANDDSSASAAVDLMNIIVVAAECAPWSKTGGLGDVAGALPKALARRGHRVMAVVPMYRNYTEPQQIGEPRHTSRGGSTGYAGWATAYPGSSRTQYRRFVCRTRRLDPVENFVAAG